jgi:hypothetical protein
MNAYRFHHKGSGMGHAWFTVHGPEGSGEVEYVTPQHFTPYMRGIYNGTPEEFERDVAASLHVLRWSADPCRGVSRGLMAAFNAWRMAEHAEFVARILAHPERYGITSADDPLLAPPVALRAGKYVLNHGWQIAEEVAEMASVHSVYVYRADIYCEACGAEMRRTIPQPAHAVPEEESTFDSDEWPKGPHANGGGEADCPQHCGGCGVFLGNPLTTDGVAYVRDVLERLNNLSPEQQERSGAAARTWATFYRDVLAD